MTKLSEAREFAEWHSAARSALVAGLCGCVLCTPPTPKTVSLAPAVTVAAVAGFAAVDVTGPTDAIALADPLARGDAAWSRRAEGHVDLQADGDRIERAIEAYGEAWQQGNGSLEAGWKLLRALWFAGEFASSNEDGARQRYDDARDVSSRAFEVLSARLSKRGLTMDNLEANAFPASFDPNEHAAVARVFFWSAINWGAWSGTHGLLATVREGVANRLYRYAQASVALDPTVDRGGAQRLLATLHAQLPRVPFLSGWVSRTQAVPWAERALEIEPDHPGSKYVLALALLETGRAERRGEAIVLLEQAATAEPCELMILEDLSTRESARKRIAALGSQTPADKTPAD